MSDLDDQTVKNLAHLCRIRCSEEEAKALVHDLKGILGYIEQLKELDTSDVEPCAHILESIVNVERDDEPGKTLDRAIFLKNAAQHVSGLVRVPIIIKQ
jgi:aspartyl-tRNA(Asn)/glutamyl-tRNA(Gln) amidotransferase subunit C